MARYRPNPGLGAISGKLGGQVHRQTRWGAVLQNPGKGAGRLTAAALASRASFASLHSLWRALSDAERLQWRGVANDLTYPNRLGVSRRLSPPQLFRRIMRYRLLAGLAVTTAPTQLNRAEPLAFLTWLLTDEPANFFTVQPFRPPFTCYSLVSMSTRLSPAPLSPWSPYRYMGPTTPSSGLINATQPFLDAFGSIPVGVQVRAKWISIRPDSLPSAPQVQTQTSVAH